MKNQVILEGELQRKPYISTTQNGFKKASFTIKVENNYIEIDSFKSINTLEELQGGETINVTGSLRKYKSAKYDTYLLAVNADKVSVVGTSQIQKEEAKAEEPAIKYEVDFSDLPF